MGLQFVIGGAGTGKSCYTYDFIIREASAHPDVFYYILVPEQFTLRTQKTVVEMTPGKGILNIDVLSFQRLAYRVMEESGGDERELLEDTGKSMVLRKIAQNREKDLPFLGSQIKKPGCLDEVKSQIWTAINSQKKRYNQSVNMKRYSISLILIEIQIKTIM